MDCRPVRARTHDYLEGALDPSERKAFEEHLAGCPGCRQAVERARRLEALVVKGFPVPERPEAEWDRLRLRIVARARPRRRLLWGAAAVILVGLGIARAFRSEPPPRTQEPAASAPRAVPAPSRTQPRPLRRDPPPPAPSAPLLPPTPRIPEEAGPSATAADALERMARESVEAGLATSARERVQVFCRAAEARLEEMDAALRGNDPALAQELAQTYTIILREGVGKVLAEREDPASEMAAAHDIVRLHAGKNEGRLAALERSAPSGVRGSIREALEASREVGRTP